jgi:arylsulfatase A-like enzyme
MAVSRCCLETSQSRRKASSPPNSALLITDSGRLSTGWTDNGGSTCNFGDNTPLRGTKYTLWEGGIRVPMIWRWPKQLPAGQQTEAMISAMDIVPTLAALAGATPDAHADGIDILPALCGNADAGQQALHWDCEFQWAVRSGGWKLSRVADNQQTRHLRDYEHAPMGNGWFLADLARASARSATS